VIVLGSDTEDDGCPESSPMISSTTRQDRPSTSQDTLKPRRKQRAGYYTCLANWRHMHPSSFLAVT